MGKRKWFGAILSETDFIELQDELYILNDMNPDRNSDSYVVEVPQLLSSDVLFSVLDDDDADAALSWRQIFVYHI